MSYLRQSPDYGPKVQEIARKYPAEWEAARKDATGHRDDRFIRLLAWELHQVDPKVGLNGKRGGDEISRDALSYLNPSGPGGVEVIDVIVGASHQAAWQDVTIPGNPDGSGAVPGKFIKPAALQGGSAPRPSGTGVFVDLAGVLAPLLEELAALKQTVAEQGRVIAALKSGSGQPAVTIPKAVALKSRGSGRVVCADLSKGPDAPLCASRDTVGAWEQFDLIVVE